LSGTRQRLHRHPQLVTARAQNLLLLLPRALVQMPPTVLEVRRARQSRWAPHLGRAGEVQSSALLTSSIWCSSCASAWTPRFAQILHCLVALLRFGSFCYKPKKESRSVCAGYTLSPVRSHTFLVTLRHTAKVVDAHYDLARRVSVALVHEERRVGYLTREIRTMIRQMDASGRGLAPPLILSRSELARNLRKVLLLLLRSCHARRYTISSYAHCRHISA
jgi:hypothetical protein